MKIYFQLKDKHFGQKIHTLVFRKNRGSNNFCLRCFVRQVRFVNLKNVLCKSCPKLWKSECYRTKKWFK